MFWLYIYILFYMHIFIHLSSKFVMCTLVQHHEQCLYVGVVL